MKVKKFIKIISLTVLLGIVFSGCDEKVTHNNLGYKVITSPITGKKWLDRNLGATEACKSPTDKACYGDYYQWGRLTDGHEKAGSLLTTSRVKDVSDVGNKFVVGYKDWTLVDDKGNIRITQWSKTDGTGICPVGFRVPTITELKAETIGYLGTDNKSAGAVKVIDSGTAFQNFLKLPVAGIREAVDGSIGEGISAFWTNSTSDDKTSFFGISTNGTRISDIERGLGFSVRCISNEQLQKHNETVQKVFKTGQTRSYTIGDDGTYTLGRERSFTRNNEKEIVTDNITKLQWQDDEIVKTVKVNWATATTTTCQNLTLGGYSDWRLPSIEELESIVNYGAFAPAKYSEFLNMSYNNYWSSHSDVEDSIFAWYVNFYEGNNTLTFKSDSSYIRCVRAGL